MASLITLVVLLAIVVGIVALAATFARLIVLSKVSPPPTPVVTDSDLAARRAVARLDRITNSLRADLRQWERGRR